MTNLCPSCKQLDQPPVDRESYEEIDSENLPYGTFKIDGQTGMTYEGYSDKMKRTPFTMYFHNNATGKKLKLTVPVGTQTAGEELYDSAADAGSLVGKTFSID